MMRGQEFLDIAHDLEHFEGEAWDRTRIGRLYYGVYLEFRQFCEDRLGFSRQHMAREHSAVIHLISALNTEASENLNELRIIRNQADYDLEWSRKDIAGRARAAAILATSLMNQLMVLRATV